MKLHVSETWKIARICHEANRAYCEGLGDYSIAPWWSAPADQRESSMKGVEFFFSQLSIGIDPPPFAMHEAWVAKKLKDGWREGPVKDEGKKIHPNLVPYDKLPPEQRFKDYLFAAICRTAYAYIEEAERATKEGGQPQPDPENDIKKADIQTGIKSAT